MKNVRTYNIKFIITYQLWLILIQNNNLKLIKTLLRNENIRILKKKQIENLRILKKKQIKIIFCLKLQI